MGNTLMWIAFNLFVIAMLALDLGVFHRKERAVRVREALAWSAVWVVLALIFTLGLYYWRSAETAQAFLAGYLIEKSLSIDNIFVFVLIFSFFKVPASRQHKVLFWGVFSALIMRAFFIATGVALIQRFHWVIYVFGAFLIFTGLKMLRQHGDDIHPERNPLMRLACRFLPFTERDDGGGFFVKESGRLVATPLFMVLIMIETSDLLFAVDSIPAILAVSTDPFIVYSSNVFAILGLRSLYFALAGIVKTFHYLRYGLSAVLVFVGTKMLLADVYKVPIAAALVVILAILVLSILLSLVITRRSGATNLERAEG